QHGEGAVAQPFPQEAVQHFALAANGLLPVAEDQVVVPGQVVVELRHGVIHRSISTEVGPPPCTNGPKRRALPCPRRHPLRARASYRANTWTSTPRSLAIWIRCGVPLALFGSSTASDQRISRCIAGAGG